MANAFTVQILQDGPRNATVKLVGVLDSSDLASTTAIAMSSLNQGGTGPTVTQCRIDNIDYSISDQLTVQLLWDATTPVVAVALAGRDELELRDTGGLQNNAGSGKTGTINILTKGWASGTQTFTIIMDLVKQGAGA